MDFKDVEQLLERYWQCETTVEEEAALRSFFCGSTVPAHLLCYKELFVYLQQQQEVGLGEDFDARVLAAIDKREDAVPVVKAHRLSLVSRLMPLYKAVAVVVLILSLGRVMQRSFLPWGDTDVMTADTIGNRINTPSVALSKEAKSVSAKQFPDTLQLKKQKELPVEK
ncbi:MAG: hypothetical protein IJ494_04510 [Bacteroides sp.]|nr:hypothetical protein [Bacteroides sp.]